MTITARKHPQEYGTAVVKPPDFDAFWQAVEARAARIPLNAELVLNPLRSTPKVEVFEVYYDSLDGLRIFGWYCLPRERPTRLPAIIFYPGYISEPTLPKDWAARGYATFGAAPRGKLKSNSHFNPGYPGLLTHNIVDPHTYGYQGFYVDAWRVVDFLRSRPEVDAARIGATGGSQGGALTILTAAMRPLAAAAPQAPYLAGMIDAVQLTHTYPYEEINEYLRLYPDRRDDVTRTLAYYDCIAFADRITCPMLVNIGLNDDVCPPETGYAVFNAMTGTADKQLYAYPACGHDANEARHTPLIAEFFARHLRPGESK